MKKKRLTKRQKEVLRWVEDFIDYRGYSPSFEQIAVGLHLIGENGKPQTSSVSYHVDNLVELGYFTKSKKRGWYNIRIAE